MVGDDPAITVGHVGTVPPVDDRIGLRAVEAAATSEGWHAVDCALFVGAAGLEALAAAGDLPVPAVLYDPEDDPTVAARATRLGADEYVPGAALGETTLSDRLAAVASAADDQRREGTALRALHAVATDRSLGFDEKIDRLLDVGRERLGLEVGFLTEADGDGQTVVAAAGDHPLADGDADAAELLSSYGRRTIESDGLLGIHDATDTGDADGPASERSGLACYLGGTVTVEDGRYGTLSFAGASPRDREFSPSERTFVELLVAWVSYEIERDRRERSLRRYRAVHETVEGMVFVVGREARLELATTPLADRFGYEREELLGRPLTDLLGGEAVQEGYEALEKLQAGADSVAVELTAPTADGGSVPIEVELSLLSSESEFEGLVGVVYDRSELSETRAELAAERDRFQNLFDRVPDPVVDVTFVDGEPVVRAVNAAFEEVFGYDAEAVVGGSLNDVIVPADETARARELDAEALAEGDSIAELERETADGRRTFLFRGFRYADDDERAFGIYTDITDQLEQERRLRVLHRLLRHNLRNDMTAIIGYADVIAGRVDDPADRGHAAEIRSQAEGVVDLSDQVRWIEQALDRERQPDVVDPAAVVESVVDRHRATDGATVRVDAEAAVPAMADGLLELAVENLIENALEHAPEPTVEVEVAPGEDGWVDIVVRDDGPGIPEREREVVSGDREITQMDHSRGLGLWVTRWILEGIGGRLVFGDQSDGATVVLRLRRAPEPAG